MPTLLNEKGFRFFFYSNENNELIHIHVKKGHVEGKIWLELFIVIAWLHGLLMQRKRKSLNFCMLMLKFLN